MKVKEISVGTARKLGLPGYSSYDVNAFVTVTLEDGDLPADAYKRAWDTVDEQVVGRIKSKGLESPIAAESQNPDDPADWLNHDTPDQQQKKIESQKKIQEMLKGTKDTLKNISVKPTQKGGE